MQSLMLSQKILFGERSPPTPFNVVIMYEDFGSGKRAKKGLDYVAEELGNDLEFRHSMWRFDILQDPEINGLAGPPLPPAELLIIFLPRGGRVLPKNPPLNCWRGGQKEKHQSGLGWLVE